MFHWRIVGALALSVALIVGAYVLARGIHSPPVVQASSEQELLEAIAKRDTDSDGLPDWEEALYGTDPRAADTKNLGMSDQEAVAKGLIVPAAVAVRGDTPLEPESMASSSLPVPPQGTLTRALSESFITEYLQAFAESKDGVLSEEKMKAITDKVLNELDTSVVATPDFKKKSELKIQGSGPESLRAFAAAAEKVYLGHTREPSDTELILLQKVLETGDPVALKHIHNVAGLYEKGAVGLSVLPVPSELVDVHLKMVNALMRMSETTRDFTLADADPIATMIALKQYPEAVKKLGEAFAEVNQIYTRAGVVLEFDEAGVGYVRLIEWLMADQEAAEKAAKQKP